MSIWLKNFFTNLWLFLIPILSILFLEVIFYIPRINSFYNFIRLAPFYCGIYFWIVIRPDVFNIFSTFILGIFADIMSSAPLGVNVLMFLLLYRLTFASSTYFNIKKFSYSWLLFALIALIVYAFKWLILSAFYRTLIPYHTLEFEILLTITLYPIITRFYSLVEHKFIPLEESYEKV